jgi:SAM-dependent methyltransferase
MNMEKIYSKHFSAIYDKQWASWTDKIWPFIRRIASDKINKKGPWLDLCCGTGRLLKFAIKEGYIGYGLDASVHQLNHAKKNASAAKLILSDIRNFKLPQKFKVITCMYDSLNYLIKPNDLKKVFKSVAEHLAPGGVFIFDMNTYEGMREKWNRTWTVRFGPKLVILEGYFDAKRAIGKTVITGFIPYGKSYKKFEELHIQRGYCAFEVEKLLTQAGFVFRKYDGKQFGRARKLSGRLVYVCRAK